jgi:hypothetical protein
MKTRLLIPLVLIYGITISCQKKIDVTKEENAIKAVIEGEIKASFDGDYNAWEGFFVKEPYIVWMQG